MGWGSSSSPPRSLPIPHSSPPHHPAQRPALLSPSEDLLLLQVASDGISCQEERIAQRKPQTAAAPWGSARALTVPQEGPSARRPAELGQHGGSRGGCCTAVLSCVGTAAQPLGAVGGKVLLGCRAVGVGGWGVGMGGWGWDGDGNGDPPDWRCPLLVFPCRKEPLHQRIRSDQIGESSCRAGLGVTSGPPPAALSTASLLAGAHQVSGPAAAPGVPLLQAARQCRCGPELPTIPTPTPTHPPARVVGPALSPPPPHTPLSQKEFLRFTTSAPAGNTTPWCWSCWAPAWRICSICATAPSPSKPS